MPMFVCMVWTLIIGADLLTNRSKRQHAYLLAFMFVATLLYMGHCVYFNHTTAVMPVTDTVYCFCNLAVYPLYYLYICSLTLRRDEMRLQALMLLPAGVAAVVVGILYAMMTPEETTAFVNNYLYMGSHAHTTRVELAQIVAHDFCKVAFAILIIPVFILGSQHIRRFNRLVLSVYADTDNKTLESIHSLLVAFVVTAVMSFVFSIIGRHHFAGSFWLLSIPSTIFSLLLFVIGYLSYRQQFSIQDIESDERKADSQVPATPGIAELRERIELLMEKEQVFRQPNLKIVDLVQRLNSNRNYIYLAINGEMGMTFNEYVNRLRVEYAAKLMRQFPDKNLSQIADLSGFASSTSFYRNFRQYKGVAPKDYAIGGGTKHGKQSPTDTPKLNEEHED